MQHKEILVFVVVIMPTKATVYSKYIDYGLDKYGLIRKADRVCEAEVTDEIIKHFKYNEINYVEALPFDCK